MLERVLIDTAEVPGGGSLRLIRRGDEFSIMLGANELMNSRLSGSEEALAQLSLGRLAKVAAPRVMIGGLGMGFTLRAALDLLPPNAGVVMVELVGKVVDWARGPMAGLLAGSLDDARVEIRIADVVDSIAAARQEFDAILLDVDNGPDAITSAGNDRLYSLAGLAAARAALRPGGVLAVWSSGPNGAFTRQFGKAGFRVEVETVRARAGKGALHTIWLATRPAASPAGQER